MRSIVDDVTPVTADEARRRASERSRRPTRRSTVYAVTIVLVLVVAAASALAWNASSNDRVDVATRTPESADQSNETTVTSDDEPTPCNAGSLRDLHDEVMRLDWVDDGHLPDFGAGVNESTCSVDIESTDLTPAERRRLNELGGDRLRIIERPVENLGP